MDGILDSLTTDAPDTQLPEELYHAVEERRCKWLAGETQGLPWE